MEKAGTKYDHQMKLIIIGESSVGKTCILLRFADNQFPTNHIPTIGKNTIQHSQSNFSSGIDYRTKFITVDGATAKI